MRTKFTGFYAPTQAELKRLWTDGTFILDANVLLNLYRYSHETRDQLLGLFDDLKSRLWLPHQAGLEFHVNRLEVITTQQRQYDSLLGDFKRIIELLEATRTHPFLKKDTLAKLKSIIGETEKELDASKQQLVALESEDVLANRITEIFEGRVGDPLPQDVMENLPAEGEDRFKRSIPPGFEDRKKPDVRRYGDLVLWKQILAYAATTKRPLLFITDDAKEDWWRKHFGKIVGPLPALKDEVQTASGQAFHMYRPDRFLQYASETLKKPLKQETLKEVKESQAMRFAAELADAQKQLIDQRIRIEQDLAKRVATIGPVDSIASYQRSLQEALQEMDARRHAISELNERNSFLHETARGRDEFLKHKALRAQIDLSRAQHEELLESATQRRSFSDAIRAAEEFAKQRSFEQDLAALEAQRQALIAAAQREPSVGEVLRSKDDLARRQAALEAAQPIRSPSTPPTPSSRTSTSAESDSKTTSPSQISSDQSPAKP